jgi:hypothetical protein
MTSETIRVALSSESTLGAIPVPFDPKAAFGKLRAPVLVTVNGYTFPSTIASMGGKLFIPFRKSHQDAAGLRGDETVEVRIELDTSNRQVTPPDDLVAALKAAPHGWDRWRELSFTHQREFVEAVLGAKKAETRTRRIGNSSTR